jgi:hypothetical protein
MDVLVLELLEHILGKLVVFGIRDFASVGNEELQSLDRVNDGEKLARIGLPMGPSRYRAASSH